MKEKNITEGKAEILVPCEKKISKEMEVFYNPIMEYNRSISIALLNAINRKDMQIADPMAGTGIRAIRFFLELNKGIIKNININDININSIRLIKKNLKKNKINKNFTLSNKDANLFFLESKGFDYIDIDPFGCPNKFLNCAIERISRNGILAVTATDTGALCGSFKNACIRKYWANPLHSGEMHEVGLRILIRKVQLIGMQFDKALIPLLSFSRDHYMRVFFICEKSKTKCDEIARMHGLYKNAGPMWLGNLKKQEILDKIQLKDKFTEILKEELDILGFYDIPEIHSKEKIKQFRKIDEIINDIKNYGFKATRCHFNEQGIKSNIPYEKLLEILKKN